MKPNPTNIIEGAIRDKAKENLMKYFDNDGKLKPQFRDGIDRVPSKGFALTVGILLAVLWATALFILTMKGGLL